MLAKRMGSVLLSLILLVVCEAIMVAATASVFTGVPTTIWPQPTLYQISSNSSVLGVVSTDVFASVRDIKSSQASALSVSKMPILQKALNRYSQLVFQVPSSMQLQFDQANRWSQFVPQVSSDGLKQVQLSKLVITLQSLETNVAMDSDESYEIVVPDVNGQAIQISANNQWGALRALETLSQLIVTTVVTDKKQVVAQSIPALPVSIKDVPRFKWRGIMIDLARHFFPVEKVLDIIDAMSYEKFNKLHLHLIDAQSFPVEIPEYENLAKKGSFAPGLTYSAKQMAEIVSYANDRGIEVIPEFDMPGHAAAWANAYPAAVSTCRPGTTNINNFPVQPAANITYEIVDAMAKYAQNTFGGPYFHIGSDEVVTGCWAQDETVKAFMNSEEAKSQGIVTMYDLYGYFQKRVGAIAKKYKRTMIAWEELALDVKTKLYHYPEDEGIVQVWQLSETLKNVTDLGYKAIMSAGFYLDKQKPDPSSKDRWLWVDTWEDMYLNEPYKFVPHQDGRKLILGVEACMWSEQVTQLNIEARIWPRVSAVSERGWSPQSVNNTDVARERLINHICATLVKRGVRTGPVRPDYCPYVYTFNDQADRDTVSKNVRGLLIFSVLLNMGLFFGMLFCVALLYSSYTRYAKLRESSIQDFSETSHLRRD